MLPKAFNCLIRPRDYLNVLNVAAREFTCPTRELRENYQVEQFNRVWVDAWENVPFYTGWKREHHLPDNICSLDEVESWPIVTKCDLQKNTALFERLDRPAEGQGMTGGSTGQPLRFGTWKEDAGHTLPNMWIGRRAYGIEPGDRTWLLWGHHHLYGTGFYRRVSALKRRLKDYLLNSCRISAYDLSPSAMQSAFQKFVNFSPRFIVAFSPAILAFCRTNRAKEDACHRIQVKCVLCTAGPLTQNERQEISSFFNAPVCMEYGSAECGVMAYTVPSGGYQVFWQTHLLQTVPDFQDAHRSIVTRLTMRCFPLIRYDIGDYLDVYPNEIKRPHRFISVLGRPSEIVRFSDGTAFFGALIGDCVKQVPKVMASQTILRGDEMLIHVLADGKLTTEDADLIYQRCRMVVPALTNKRILVEQKEKLRTGISGKVILVVHE
ncbi:MAG: hypothetical protein NTX50_31340 [Candidatus Sumerlaeota bacterium]|nr:hypothetical protein [Candidatus Sumerlaeota bacterium]